MPAVHGRESIRAFFAVLNTMSSPPPVLTVRTDSVWASGAMAVDLGRWQFAWPGAAKRPPGAPAVDSGKYIVRWVNEGGHWLMAQDIWNSDVPLRCRRSETSRICSHANANQESPCAHYPPAPDRLAHVLGLRHWRAPPAGSGSHDRRSGRARIAILAANKQWMAAIAAGRADSLVLVYASTARMMGAGTPTSVGREAIGREFGEMFKIGAWKIQLHTDSVFANGPLVLETGTWTSTFKAGPHAPPIPATDKGSTWFAGPARTAAG